MLNLVHIEPTLRTKALQEHCNRILSFKAAITLESKPAMHNAKSSA